MAQKALLPTEATIAGPYSLFDGSFILEFLKADPSRNASVLMKATYKANHPFTKKGKNHPQAPPYHLHFDQSETFQVLSGKVGTTNGYSATDQIWTSADPAHEITPWTPHKFWPVADSTEDAVLLIWAHPENVPQAMDWVFFQNILLYISDVTEKKTSFDPFQIMLTQHVSATALVWFPTATFLGPLRWWVPWVVQAGFAGVARVMGKKPLMEKYTPAAEWAKTQGLKRE